MIAANGSSTKIINSPSDGSCRPVPVMLGIRRKSNSLNKESLNKGLVGWWTLDEKCGVSARDSSHSNRKGTLIGGISFDENSRVGVVGRSLALDGFAGGISFDNAKLTDRITVSAWAKLDGTLDSGHVVSCHPAWYLSGCKKQVMRFGIQSASNEISVSFGTPEELGADWHHYAGVYDGKTVRTFLDGLLIGMATFSGNLKQGGESRIGRYWKSSENGQSKYSWKGQVDEVRIYNRALSAEEIQAIAGLGSVP